MPIRDEAINVFMGLPGDGARLELTYNHGVDSYELGTGYNHIAVTVRGPRRHARRAWPRRASSPRSRPTPSARAARGCASSATRTATGSSSSRPRSSACGDRGLAMFDRVTTYAHDVGASTASYDLVLRELGIGRTGDDPPSWREFVIEPATVARPATRGLHLGFAASSTTAVDAFWRSGVAAGLSDDGAPGRRPH